MPKATSSKGKGRESPHKEQDDGEPTPKPKEKTGGKGKGAPKPKEKTGGKGKGAPKPRPKVKGKGRAAVPPSSSDSADEDVIPKLPTKKKVVRRASGGSKSKARQESEEDEDEDEDNAGGSKAMAEDDDNVVQMDIPPVTQIKTQEILQEEAMKAEVKKKFLGIGFIDLLSPHLKLKWGTFVGRSIDETHVKELEKSFEIGIDNMRDPIAILIDEDWVHVDSLAPEGSTRDRIQILRWRQAVLTAAIEVLGGGHRVEALKRIRKKIEKELEKEKAALKPADLEKRPTSKAYQREVKRRDHIKELEEKLKVIGYWAVEVYIKTGFTPVMGEFLSRNENKPNMHQGTVERLFSRCIQLEGHLLKEGEGRPGVLTTEWLKATMSKLWAAELRHNQGRDFKVLYNPYLYEFCVEISKVKYLRDGQKIKSTQLQAISDARTGGTGHLWILAVQAKLQDMRWIATPEDATKNATFKALYKDMGLLLQWRRCRINGDTGAAKELERECAGLGSRTWRTEQMEKWSALMEEMTVEPEVDLVWTGEVMGAIDKIYVAEVANAWSFRAIPGQAVAAGQRQETEWSRALLRYEGRVRDVVKAHWKAEVEKLREQGVHGDTREVDALRGAGVKWDLLNALWAEGPYERFPLPTQTFIKDMIAAFAVVTDAVRCLSIGSAVGGTPPQLHKHAMYAMVRIVDPLCDARRFITHLGILDHSTCLLLMLKNKSICSASRMSLYELPQFIFFVMAELQDVQGHLARASFNWRDRNTQGQKSSG
ncbi:hypothetical protein C2E23DRAFT_859202 [Lenzites betulinus]|nr:hypothetical protein C2E23DRAFT_859202 [Lenzites betulinus]